MKYLLSTLLFSAVLTSGAQSALDLGSRARLRGIRLDALQSSSMDYAAMARALRRSPMPQQSVMAMVRLADADATARLQQAGASVVFERGNIAGIHIPVGSVERIAALPGVERLQLSGTVQPLMHHARQASGV